MAKLSGKRIQCSRCDGRGVVSTWSFGVEEPDECPDCNGSGSNWLYPRGAIASYYSGPLIGRLALQPQGDIPGTAKEG